MMTTGKTESLSFSCLVTSGHSKENRCHVGPYSFLSLQITRADIRPQVKWAVSLALAVGPTVLPQGFLWVSYVQFTILTLSPQRVDWQVHQWILQDLQVVVILKGHIYPAQSEHQHQTMYQCITKICDNLKIRREMCSLKFHDLTYQSSPTLNMPRCLVKLWIFCGLIRWRKSM